MLILPGYQSEPKSSPFADWSHWEVAAAFTAKGYFSAVVDARASSGILHAYLASYRQRENVAIKPRFWKLYLQFVDALGRIYNVPTKRNIRREQAENPIGQLTFLSLRLTEEQFAALDETKVTSAQLMTSLAAVVEGGLGFSLNYNADKETANATLMDKRDDSPAKGYALSAFGEDVPDALKILLYKHFNILGGDWSTLIGAKGNSTKRG